MSFFLTSRSLSWYLLSIAGGALILFGSFFVTLRMIDASNLVEEARRGAWLDIQLDARVCLAKLVGVLRCDVSYKGRYTRETNAWLVRGQVVESDQVTSASYDNAPNQAGSISIFGLVAQFDQNGKLSLRGVENAGTVALSRPFWQRAFFGEADDPPSR
jgi:hypothetical protein